MDHVLRNLNTQHDASVTQIDSLHLDSAVKARMRHLENFHHQTMNAGLSAPRVSVSHVRREIFASRTAQQNRAMAEIKDCVRKAFTQTPAASHTFSFAFDYETYLNPGFIEDAVQSVFDEGVNVTTVETEEGFTVVVRLV